MSTPEMELPTRRESSSWLRRLGNYVFGFDFFISYAHADAKAYSESLEAKLKKQDFECFLDSEDYAAGDDWKKAGRLALRRTSRLILVGSPAALRSGPVLREVETFRGLKRRILPIDIGNTLGSHQEAKLCQAIGSAVIRIQEDDGALERGPSDKVVSRIRDSFDLTRQHQRRHRLLAAASVVFAVLAVLAIILAWATNQARNDALDALVLAERETRRVKAGELAARSDQAEEEYPQRSILLAVEALRATRPDEIRLPGAEQALRDRLGRFPPNALDGPGATLAWIGVTPDSRWVVARSRTHAAWLWDLTAEDPWRAGVELDGPATNASSMALSVDGSRLATGAADGRVYLWDLRAGKPDAIRRTLTGHSASVTVVAFSADRRWLLAAASDGTVRLWDLSAGGSEAKWILPRGEGAVTDVLMSGDSRWLVTWSNDTIPRLWALDAREPPASGKRLFDEIQALSEAAITPNSRWLLIRDEHDNLWSWDLAAPAVAASRRLFDEWEGSVSGIAIGFDSRWLVTPTDVGYLLLWDLEAEDPAAAATELWSWDGLEEDPWQDEIDVSISLDGRWLKAQLGSYDDGVWDLRAEEPSGVARTQLPTAARSVFRTLQGAPTLGHEGRVNQFENSPDGRWSVVLTDNGTARLWDADAETDAMAPMTMAMDYLTGARVGRDGRWLIAKALGEIYECDLHAPLASMKPIPRPSGHPHLLQRGGRWVPASPDVSVDAGGRWLHVIPTESFPDEAWLYELSDSGVPELRLTLHEEFGRLSESVLSRSGRWLAVLNDDGIAALMDLQAVDLFDAAYEPWNGDTDVEALIVSPDDRWLVIGTTSGVVRFVDLRADDPRRKPRDLRVHTDEILRFKVSPGGRWLVTDSRDNSAFLVDLHAAEPQESSWKLEGGGRPVHPQPFSPDDRWLVTRGEDDITRLWDLGAHGLSQGMRVLGDREPMIIRAWAVQGSRWLVTKYRDDTVHLWDLRAARPEVTRKEFGGHENAIRWVRVSPDGSRLVTHGEGETHVRLWDLTSDDPTGAAALLRGHRDEIEGLEITADSRWLITESRGAIRLWPLRIDHLLEIARRAAGRNLSREEWARYFPGTSYRSTFPELPD